MTLPTFMTATLADRPTHEWVLCTADGPEDRGMGTYAECLAARSENAANGPEFWTEINSVYHNCVTTVGDTIVCKLSATSCAACPHVDHCSI